MSVTAMLGLPTELGLPQLMTHEMANANVHPAWGWIRGFIHFNSGFLAATSLLLLIVG